MSVLEKCEHGRIYCQWCRMGRLLPRQTVRAAEMIEARLGFTDLAAVEYVGGPLVIAERDADILDVTRDIARSG
jgi:hypothetical protein